MLSCAPKRCGLARPPVGIAVPVKPLKRGGLYGTFCRSLRGCRRFDGSSRAAIDGPITQGARRAGRLTIKVS